MIRIENERFYAVVEETEGANVLSFVEKSKDLHFLREEAIPHPSRLRDNPYLYGMPILFPVNRIAGGSYVCGGVTYRLAVNEPKTGCHLHGLLHQTPFEVVERGADFVTCRYVGNLPTCVPEIPMELTVTVRLTENGLSQTVMVVNRSDLHPLPLMLGFHTTFSLPFGKGGADRFSMRAEVGDFIERDMTNYLPTGKIVPRDGFADALNKGTLCPAHEGFSRHYLAANDGVMEFCDRAAGVILRYDNSPNYTHRLFFRAEGADYVVAEPNSCMADAANSPLPRAITGFRTLPPQGEEIFTSSMTVRPID